MTHVVYLAMMLSLNGGVAQQQSTEASMQDCTAIITQMAAQERGNRRHFWYCQPAVANASLGPPS